MDIGRIVFGKSTWPKFSGRGPLTLPSETVTVAGPIELDFNEPAPPPPPDWGLIDEPFEVVVGPDWRRFLSVYVPRDNTGLGVRYGGSRAEYGIQINVGALTDAQKNGLRIKEVGGTRQTNTRAFVPPEVYGRYANGNTGMDWVVEELATLDARNMSRDRLFDGRSLVLTLRRYAYDARGVQGVGLTLVRVEVTQ